MRGAPLIGATAAYGVWLALRADASDEALEQRLCHARRHAADRDQSQMGPRRNAGGRAQPPARRARRRCVCGAPAKSPMRMSPSTRPSAAHGLQIIEDIAAQKKKGERVQRAHPLQCRLAGDRRLGNGDRADL